MKLNTACAVYKGWGGVDSPSASSWLHAASLSYLHKFNALFSSLVISETLPHCLKRMSTRTTSSWVNFTVSHSILSTYISVQHVEWVLWIYLSSSWEVLAFSLRGAWESKQEGGWRFWTVRGIKPISSQNADRAALVDLVDETGKIEVFFPFVGFFSTSSVRQQKSLDWNRNILLSTMSKTLVGFGI